MRIKYILKNECIHFVGESNIEVKTMVMSFDKQTKMHVLTGANGFYYESKYIANLHRIMQHLCTLTSNDNIIKTTIADMGSMMNLDYKIKVQPALQPPDFINDSETEEEEQEELQDDDCELKRISM